MSDEYFKLKDNGRKGLLEYFFKAWSLIPKLKNARILDIGCGTGVISLALAEKVNDSFITAIDVDSHAVGYLKTKVNKLNISKRFGLRCGSFFDIDFKEKQFDIIISEGFLNVVGFEKGFRKINKLLRVNGYLIIHDDTLNTELKKELLNQNKYLIVDSFRLNEKIWWENYYKILEKEIGSCQNKQCLKHFKDEIQQIKWYKKDSSYFRSVYYTVKKIGSSQ